MQPYSCRLKITQKTPKYQKISSTNHECNPYLFQKILDDTVLGHLGSNGKSSLHLLLYAWKHFLVLLSCESLHTFKRNICYNTNTWQATSWLAYIFFCSYPTGFRTWQHPAWTPGTIAVPLLYHFLQRRAVVSSYWAILQSGQWLPIVWKVL